MNVTLTKDELKDITDVVSKKLYTQFIADGSQKELQRATENYTGQMIKFYLTENAISYDVAKMIKPILDEHLKQSRIIEDKLSEYMTTDNFKKIELRHLERRCQQIREELENE